MVVVFAGFAIGAAAGLKTGAPGFILAVAYIVLWQVWLEPWFTGIFSVDFAPVELQSLVLLPASLAALVAVFLWWITLGMIVVGFGRLLVRLIKWWRNA